MFNSRGSMNVKYALFIKNIYSGARLLIKASISNSPEKMKMVFQFYFFLFWFVFFTLKLTIFYQETSNKKLL